MLFNCFTGSVFLSSTTITLILLRYCAVPRIEKGHVHKAIKKYTQTRLRDIIGSMDLDETLVSRNTINARLAEILDEATNKWGIGVKRIKLQKVNPLKIAWRSLF